MIPSPSLSEPSKGEPSRRPGLVTKGIGPTSRGSTTSGVAILAGGWWYPRLVGTARGITADLGGRLKWHLTHVSAVRSATSRSTGSWMVFHITHIISEVELRNLSTTVRSSGNSCSILDSKYVGIPCSSSTMVLRHSAAHERSSVVRPGVVLNGSCKHVAPFSWQTCSVMLRAHAIKAGNLLCMRRWGISSSWTKEQNVAIVKGARSLRGDCNSLRGDCNWSISWTTAMRHTGSGNVLGRCQPSLHLSSRPKWRRQASWPPSGWCQRAGGRSALIVLQSWRLWATSYQQPHFTCMSLCTISASN